LVRKGRVREGLRQLQSELHQSDESQTPAQSATNVQAACLSVYKELIMLENFAIISHTAFSKILKKHDKRTQFSTRDQFMRNLVNLQSFARYPKLKEMLHELEGMYKVISSLQSPPPAKVEEEDSGVSGSEGVGSTDYSGGKGCEENERRVAEVGAAWQPRRGFGFGSPLESEIEHAKTLTREARSELETELEVDSAPEYPAPLSSPAQASSSSSSSSSASSSAQAHFQCQPPSSFSTLLFAAASAEAATFPGSNAISEVEDAVGLGKSATFSLTEREGSKRQKKTPAWTRER
jgi:hypothetical protein